MRASIARDIRKSPHPGGEVVASTWPADWTGPREKRRNKGVRGKETQREKGRQGEHGWIVSREEK